MNLQKYRTHGVGRHGPGFLQAPGLSWGAAGQKGSRAMSYHQLLQLWIAGVVEGVMIALILWDLSRPGGPLPRPGGGRVRCAWTRLPGAR